MPSRKIILRSRYPAIHIFLTKLDNSLTNLFWQEERGNLPRPNLSAMTPLDIWQGQRQKLPNILGYAFTKMMRHMV